MDYLVDRVKVETDAPCAPHADRGAAARTKPCRIFRCTTRSSLGHEEKVELVHRADNRVDMPGEDQLIFAPSRWREGWGRGG